jgi:hypothetical protein
MPGGNCTLAEPHGKGHAKREDGTSADDDEPSESLGKWGGASEEGAATVIGLAVVCLVSAIKVCQDSGKVGNFGRKKCSQVLGGNLWHLCDYVIHVGGLFYAESSQTYPKAFFHVLFLVFASQPPSGVMPIWSCTIMRSSTERQRHV